MVYGETGDRYSSDPLLVPWWDEVPVPVALKSHYIQIKQEYSNFPIQRGALFF